MKLLLNTNVYWKIFLILYVKVNVSKDKVLVLSQVNEYIKTWTEFLAPLMSERADDATGRSRNA